MASFNTAAVAVKNTAERFRKEGEQAAKTISAELKGPSPTDFLAFALKLGHLTAVRLSPLTYSDLQRK